MGVSRPKHRFMGGILLPLCLFCSLAVQASEREYLEAIKADMEEFYTHEFKPPAGSPWVVSTDTASGGGESEFETLEAFSRFVQKKSPGSYIFYNKLPAGYQKRVHEDYLATGDLNRMKNNIFRFSREVKKRQRAKPSSFDILQEN